MLNMLNQSFGCNTFQQSLQNNSIQFHSWLLLHLWLWIMTSQLWDELLEVLELLISVENADQLGDPTSTVDHLACGLGASIQDIPFWGICGSTQTRGQSTRRTCHNLSNLKDQPEKEAERNKKKRSIQQLSDWVAWKAWTSSDSICSKRARRLKNQAGRAWGVRDRGFGWLKSYST